jgi:hypothetical protein
MSKQARLVLSFALVAGVLAGAAPLASANSYSVRDGRDISNADALDIVSAKVGHKRDKLRHAVTLERRVNPRTLQRIGGFISFILDTDGDLGDAERRIYVLGGSHFRVYVTNGSGRTLLGRGRSYHPNARTLGAVVTRAVLGAPDGYHWFAVAVTDGPGDCCVDLAPENWYIHDLTAPEIDPVSFGDGALTAVAGKLPAVTVPATWHATDSGFGGIADWTVRARLEGVEQWSDVASGRYGYRNRRFDVTRTTDTGAWAQGVNVEVCVSVSDWAGNRATSGTHHFSVPYDDSHIGPTGVFRDRTSGVVVATEVSADDYLGTRTIIPPGDSLTIEVQAGLQHALVVPPGYDGVVRVTVNGEDNGDVTSLTSGSPRAIKTLGATGWNADGTDTIVLENISGSDFAIDGYLGAPVYVGGTPDDDCGGGPTVTRVRTATGMTAAPPPLRASLTRGALERVLR